MKTKKAPPLVGATTGTCMGCGRERPTKKLAYVLSLRTRRIREPLFCLETACDLPAVAARVAKLPTPEAVAALAAAKDAAKAAKVEARKVGRKAA